MARSPIGRLTPCPRHWPAASYEQWSATCDTLHAHTQVLGKLAVLLAPPEPQLQHAALRLTARGWETAPLPAPDGSGAFVAALDLRSHEALVEHSDGRSRRVALAPDRPVGAGDARGCSTRCASSPARRRSTRPRRRCRGRWRSTRTRSTPLTTRAQVSAYFAAATQAALVLAAFRAPYRGRSTPVNAWWGSFDLAVNLFSGDERRPAVAMTSSCATRWTRRRSRSAGGRVIRATARRRSTPTRTRRPTASPMPTSRPGALGRATRRVRPGLG